MLKRSLIIGFFFLCLAGAAHAQTCVGVVCTAVDCTPNSVQAAMNQVNGVNGPPYTTVALPSCNVSWTVPATGHTTSIVSWSPPPNAILRGQTTVAYTTSDGITHPTSAVDNTVITDHVCKWNGGDCANQGSLPLFSITLNASGTFRMFGFTISQAAADNTCSAGTQNCFTSNNGELAFFGSNSQFRLDDNHFTPISGLGIDLIGGNIYGVVDHNFVENGVSTNNNFKIEATTWNGGGFSFGDGSWADDTTFGSNRFLFFENNTFVNGTNNDCIHGGRYVWRFNHHTDGSIQTHPTGGSGRARGCRATEIYGNIYRGTRPSTFEDFNYMFLSSGPSLIYSNSDAGTHAYQNFTTIHSMRRDNSTYSRGPTPGDWGYCGTSFNGTGSGWDQNITAAIGYRCLDQPGNGKGDQLTGQFPNACNQTLGCSTFNGQWPRQIIEPVYIWLNTWAGSGGGSFVAIQNSGSAIVQNREVYMDVGATCAQNAASCSTGMGSGTLAQRPAQCTPNSQPDTQGNIPGVAWWATDTTTLYRCTATNTWTSYYSPFTYPHPLVGGGGTPQAATPTFSPVAGPYLSPQIVTISSTSGGVSICYTIDGTVPTANGSGTCTHGTTLANGGTVNVAFTQQLKAIATGATFTDSAVGSAQYTFSTGSATVTFAGKFNTGSLCPIVKSATQLCYALDCGCMWISMSGSAYSRLGVSSVNGKTGTVILSIQ